MKPQISPTHFTASSIVLDGFALYQCRRTTWMPGAKGLGAACRPGSRWFRRASQRRPALSSWWVFSCWVVTEPHIQIYLSILPPDWTEGTSAWGRRWWISARGLSYGAATLSIIPAHWAFGEITSVVERDEISIHFIRGATRISAAHSHKDKHELLGLCLSAPPCIWGQICALFWVWVILSMPH